MVLHIPDIRVIRLFMSFAIPSSDFIMNSHVLTNDTNFNRLFFGNSLVERRYLNGITSIGCSAIDPDGGGLDGPDTTVAEL